MPSIPRGLVEALQTEPSVRLAVVFGSEARDSARRGSDVDVGVLGPSSHQMSQLQVTLARATGRVVDLIAMEHAPPLLRFEIAREGQVIVERTPHLWSDFKARAMVDWWDWAPLARLFSAAAAARLHEKSTRGSF